MKHVSKIACFFLVITCYNITFGMLRSIFRPTSKRPIQLRQLSSQQQHITQAQALATPAKASPSTYENIQQKLAEIKAAGKNAWNKLSNMFSNAPVTMVPQQPLEVDIAPPAPTTALATTIPPEASLEKDFNFLLDNIENKFNKINQISTKKEITIPEELKTAVKKVAKEYLILCPDPTEEVRHLLRMKSLSTFEKYIQSKKRTVLKKMGFTKQEIITLEYEIKVATAEFIEQYKQINKKNDYDTKISSEQIDIAEELLKAVGVEPSNISIRSTTSDHRTKDTNGALEVKFLDTPDALANPYKASSCQTILYLKPKINQLPWENMVFTTAHEIGHLIKCHDIEYSIIGRFFYDVVQPRAKKKYTDNQFFKYDRESNKLYNKILISLYELEADIWMATQYQEIAEISRKAMIRYSDRPDIYQSPSDNLYTLTKIIQLHNKEKKEARKNKITPPGVAKE